MFQFRLRTLLIIVAVAALVVWLGIWWERRDWARISWVNSSAPEAGLVAGQSRIETDGEVYKAIFQSRCRDIDELWPLVVPTGGWALADREHSATNDLYQYITVTSPNKVRLDAALATWQRGDVLQPGDVVINGIVRDREGAPTPDLQIDLIGPKPQINECRTRDNGTFLMLTPALPGTYYLRIRDGHGNETRTASFKLGKPPQESTASIRVPWTRRQTTIYRGKGGIFGS